MHGIIYLFLLETSEIRQSYVMGMGCLLLVGFVRSPFNFFPSYLTIMPLSHCLVMDHLHSLRQSSHCGGDLLPLSSVSLLSLPPKIVGKRV